MRYLVCLFLATFSAHVLVIKAAPSIAKAALIIFSETMVFKVAPVLVILNNQRFRDHAAKMVLVRTPKMYSCNV